MIVSRYLRTLLTGSLLASLGMFAHAQESNKPMVYEGTGGGLGVIKEGQPPVMVHPLVEESRAARAAEAREAKPQGQASTANDLNYHGGVGGIGVETAPKIYLVLWGSQWNNNDPSGEAGILENFYNGAGGSSWLKSVTQYCQGVASGTFYCNGAGTAAE